MLGTLRDSTFRKLFDLENGSVTARRVDSFITWLIIANLVALAMEHFPIYTGNEALFGTFDRISIYIFTLEYVLRLSVPITWVTDYSGDIGNTLASKGFGAHSK